MTLYDYDWVVIGAAPTARAAVEYAARYRARVAWLIGPKPDSSPWRGFHALRQLLLQQPCPEACLPLSPPALESAQALFAQAQRLAQVSEDWDDPSALQSLGVDVIAGAGQLIRRDRHLHLFLEQRGQAILGRRYLLAPAAMPLQPPLPGLEQLPWDTLPWDTLQSWLDWPQLPRSVTFLGADPLGIALAQMLARLGCEVKLVTGAALGMEPVDATQVAITAPIFSLPHPPLHWSQSWLKALLGAEQVQLIQAEHTLTFGPGLTVQADEQTWSTERLLVAVGWQPDWQGIGGAALEGFDLKGLITDSLTTDRLSQARAQLSPWGQTRDPQIYWAGTVPFQVQEMQAQETQVQEITRHALLWPWYALDRRYWRWRQGRVQVHVLWTLPSVVDLAFVDPNSMRRQLSTRVGQNDRPPDYRSYLAQGHDNLRLQLTQGEIGQVELRVQPDTGRLWGATLVGPEATEWMGAIALALQQRLSVDDLAQLPYPNPSFAAMVRAAAEQWRWQQLSSHPRREDLWERFFNWRRTGGI